MLHSFDWIRLSQTGAELLATLEYLDAEPKLFQYEVPLGAPFSALGGPCQRCWAGAPLVRGSKRKKSLSPRYCKACAGIVARAAGLGKISRHAITIWGYVNHIPRHLDAEDGFYARYSKGRFVYDHQHFLLLLHRKELLPWLQELALYHGPDLQGHIQIFPTVGLGKGLDMGELLCRAMHLDSRFAMDRLWVRFYSAPYQLLRPHERDRQGLLTFDAADFMHLLEMAMVFKSVIYPDEQKLLHDLLHLDEPVEKRFYWGRFMRFLHQEARDMLSAWNIRQWPEHRVKLLYELIEYVVFEQTY